MRRELGEEGFVAFVYRIVCKPRVYSLVKVEFLAVLKLSCSRGVAGLSPAVRGVPKTPQVLQGLRPGEIPLPTRFLIIEIYNQGGLRWTSSN
jgi:hypothetical protein